MNWEKSRKKVFISHFLKKCKKKVSSKFFTKLIDFAKGVNRFVCERQSDCKIDIPVSYDSGVIKKVSSLMYAAWIDGIAKEKIDFI
jgi:hypothetical protein